MKLSKIWITGPLFGFLYNRANYAECCLRVLTHWGRVTHICVGKLTIIGSDNGLSPGRRQAIIWFNAGILLIGPWGTNFSEILIANQAFSFKKMHLKISSAKWRPFSLGLNMLNPYLCGTIKPDTEFFQQSQDLNIGIAFHCWKLRRLSTYMQTLSILWFWKVMKRTTLDAVEALINSIMVAMGVVCFKQNTYR